MKKIMFALCLVLFVFGVNAQDLTSTVIELANVNSGDRMTIITTPGYGPQSYWDQIGNLAESYNLPIYRSVDCGYFLLNDALVSEIMECVPEAAGMAEWWDNALWSENDIPSSEQEKLLLESDMSTQLWTLYTWSNDPDNYHVYKNQIIQYTMWAYNSEEPIVRDRAKVQWEAIKDQGSFVITCGLAAGKYYRNWACLPKNGYIIMNRYKINVFTGEVIE